MGSILINGIYITSTHVSIYKSESCEMLEDESLWNKPRILDSKVSKGGYVFTPVTLNWEHITLC